MARIDNDIPHWGVYPWPAGFDQPDSPNYISTRDIVLSCHSIGNSYHEWRNIRYWSLAMLAGEVFATQFSDVKFNGEYYLKTLFATGGVFVTAAIFTEIRDRQFKKCFEDVGNEVQRRHDAEVAEKKSQGAAFWASTPFQIMGALQTVKDGIDAAAVREAKVVGQAAQELAMPAIVLSLMAFGAMKAVETGDTSTLQRAWAMVR